MFKKPNDPQEVNEVPETAKTEGTKQVPEWHLKRLAQFDRACSAGKTIFDHKNLVYNDAFAEGGLLGVVIELRGLAKRLHHMVVKDSGHGSNTDQALILELLKDLHNYSAMGMMTVADKNYVGT